jgi:hypothetical protein
MAASPAVPALPAALTQRLFSGTIYFVIIEFYLEQLIYGRTEKAQNQIRPQPTSRARFLKTPHPGKMP